MKQCVALGVMLLSACGSSQGSDEAVGDAPRQPELVGKVWAATDASAAPGTFRIFLADGTLVMDSCWETYRLAAWHALDDQRIEWTEDTARIEARVTELTRDRLELELRLAGEVRRESYAPAAVPTVCPDMPR